MTQKYSHALLDSGSILGVPIPAETLSQNGGGNNSFLRKMGANSKVALATGAFLALFVANSAAETLSITKSEDDGVVKIGMKMECLSPGGPDSTSIEYSSSDGTATAGSSDSSDYAAVDGVLIWENDANSCDTTKFFDFSIYDDDIAEGNETVNFIFSNGDTAVLTILDNELPDNPPTFDFSQPSYNVDEDADVATIGVTMTCPSGANQSSTYVLYSSSDGDRKSVV